MAVKQDRQKETHAKKLAFDDALERTGFGKYNFGMFTSCYLLILAMFLDMFGLSVVLPAVACDMQLTTAQQGLLSAIPLIGVMVSSYAWGLCVDTLGRRKILLYGMPIGVLLGLLASMAPTYPILAALKLLSAGFTSSASAAAFVLIGECTPNKYRSKFMFLLASATMFEQCVISAFAIPILGLAFTFDIPWLMVTYRPWRLVLQVISIPGAVGCIGTLAFHESPKFLLDKGKEDKALNVLRSMYAWNNGMSEDDYAVESVYLEEEETKKKDDSNSSFFKKMWNHTAPLFKPPLLKNSLTIYYILFCAYMTTTGYTMWVPTMTNAYFDGSNNAGQTFCHVASRAGRLETLGCMEDCDRTIRTDMLYAVMIYSGGSGIFTIMLSYLVGPLGMKRTTILVFLVAAVAGLCLLFVTIPLVSIGLFFVFLYVSLIIGNVNTYLVELNPTYLRGMASCLSVAVARGSGFFSVQLIAALLADNCVPMLSGYVILVLSGVVASMFLPADARQRKDTSSPS